MSGVTVIHLPEPETPSLENSEYLGDGAYVIPETEDNCWEWIIHTQRAEGLHWIALGQLEMENLIAVYNRTRKQ